METTIMKDGKHKFIFLNTNRTPMGNPVADPYTWPIQINEYQAQDLQRYCYKQYLENDTPIDFNKVMKTALSWYIGKEVNAKDEKEIERIKRLEAKAIEDGKRQGKIKQLNNFEWNTISKEERKETEDGHKKG
jgi:hypothetical protein